MTDSGRATGVNAEQVEAWDGGGGDFWAAHIDRFEAGVAGYHGTLMDAAGIGDGDRVLDVGCGAGRTTVDAGRRAGGGSALGVDLSGRLLGLARERAAREGAGNVRFEQADAQVHPFPPAGFDVVLSRNGSMFFDDLPAAFANIGAGLRAGGRLTLLAWQPLARNEWLRTFRAILGGDRVPPLPGAGAPGPMGLSDPDLVRELLDTTGYTDVRITGLEAPMSFGADTDEAYRYVSAQHAGLAADLDEAARAAALAALRADLAAHGGPDGVRYDSAAWLIQARRAA